MTQPETGCNTTHTEAPVSMNTFVEVDSVRRVQVTARGTDAGITARDLRQAVDAVRQEFAPAPRPSREDRLHTLLSKALLCAHDKEDYDLMTRLSKGASLVKRDVVEMGERAGTYAVRSASNPLTWYTVEQCTCSCEDWTRHSKKGVEKWYCKHICSVVFYQRLETQEVTQ